MIIFRRKKLIVLMVIFTLLLSGCSFPKFWQKDNSVNNAATSSTANVDTTVGHTTIAQELSTQNKIKKFSDYQELQKYMEENPALGGGYGRTDMRMVDTVMSKAAPAAMGLSQEAQPMADKAANTAGGNTPTNDYSRTNVQKEGVDEADIIKNDGQYIYAVVNKSLFIISATPADKADIISKIEFKSWPQNIYINGNELAVFGHDDNIYNTDLYRNFRRQSDFSFFKVFDISDKKNPKEVRDLNFEGTYNDSRMIGDYVYFITSNYNFYSADELPIAKVLENGKLLPNDKTAPRCNCPDVYYFDLPYDSYNFTNVYAINIKDNNQAFASQTYMMPGNQNTFVSEDNLYLTYTKYISEYQIEMEVTKDMLLPRLSAKDQERIAKITQVENFILSPQEKLDKINRIIQAYVASLNENDQNTLSKELEVKLKSKFQEISKDLEKTVVHKIAIDKSKLDYIGYGEVTGMVLNQFSMDEENGYFRIATTKNQQWSRYDNEPQKSYNNLFVLDPKMNVVGSVENIAPDERIYSVRYMQNRAYMVTFKQTDPLFVIDLKEPTQPKILGRLTMPGFSEYLHPYDENTLIGIGHATEITQESPVPMVEGAKSMMPIMPPQPRVATKGLKISLFNVSDVSKPSEVAKYELGGAGSNSIALSDHHAFLFSKEKKLLALPVSLNTAGSNFNWGKLEFSGLAVFEITPKSITLKGKIDHSDNGTPGIREEWTGYNYYDNTVKRSLYIGDTLYSFSSKYLKMNKMGDLAPVKTLELKKEKKDEKDYQVIN